MLMCRRIAAIHDTLKNPSLRDVLLHWQAARGDKSLPGWNDIDPVALRQHLSILWSWRYDRTEDKFIGRIAGESIVFLLGKSPRRMLMEDFFDAATHAVVYPRFKQVIEQRHALITSGPVYSPIGRCGIGERLVLPLAEDGQTPDEVMGATCYELVAPGEIEPFDARSESVVSFAL
jgi:hypothetical protein